MAETIAASLFAFWAGVLVHLWQVTLILVPLFLVDRWLRHAPSGVIHLIWSAGLIKLFLPLALFGGLARGVLRLFPQATLPLVSQPSNPALTAVTTVLTVPGSQSAKGMESHWLVWIIVVGTALWVSGVVWCFMRLAGEIAGMRSAGTNMEVPLAGAEEAKLRRALDRAGIPVGRVRIDGVGRLPSVVGFFKPAIRLPRRLVANLPDDELYAVLVHEDAHRRRLDPLRALAHRLCASLLFFYPLIWPLLRRLRDAAEFVCDDEAVRRGIPQEVYARAVSRTLQMGLSPAGAVSMAGTGTQPLIRRRLDRLTFKRRSPMTMIHRLLIAGVVLLVGIGSFWPLEKAVGDSNNAPAISAVEDDAQQNADNKRETKAKVRKQVVARETTEIESKPPQLLQGPTPQFPEAAKIAGVEALVVVRVRVTAEGTVDSVVVDVTSKSHAEDFEKAVRDVVYKWRFKPAETEDAKLRKAWVKTKIQFRLEDCDGDTKGDPSSKTGVKPRSEPSDDTE